MSTQTNPSYNFVNALVTLKDNQQPLNEMKLRETRVFGKLMILQGGKFDPKNTKYSQFYQSSSKKHIRAELFIRGSKNQIITDNRVFVNIQIEDIVIQMDPINRFWFVELIHPSIDVDACAVVEFKA